MSRCKTLTNKFSSLVYEGSDHLSKLFSPKIIKKYELTNPTGFSSVIHTGFGELNIVLDDSMNYNRLWLEFGDDDRSVGAVPLDIARLTLGEKPESYNKNIKDLGTSLDDKSDIKYLRKMIKDLNEDFQKRLIINASKSDKNFHWYSKATNTESKHKPMSSMTLEYYSTATMAKERLQDGEFYSILIDNK